MVSKKKRLKKALSDKVEQVLDLPCGVLSDIPRIELNGNSEVVIDGCYGLLSYDDDSVQLHTGCGTLQILGQNLTVSALGCGTSMVNGKILSLDFIE